MAAASASSQISFRRPNGRLPACNNCKLRKVACDHRQPVCKRCIDRGQEADCVYTSSVPRKGPFSKQSSLRDPGASAGATPHTQHQVDASAPRTAGPAPIQRPGSAEDYRSLRRAEFRRQSNTQIHDSPKVTSPSEPLRGVYSVESSLDHPERRRRSMHHELGSVNTTPGGHLPSDRASTPADQASGYLGFTSYSSVFEETKNSLSMLQGFHDWLPQPTNDRLRQGPNELPRYLCSPTKEMCLVVLRGIPAPNTAYIEIVNESPFYREGWMRTVARRVLADVHERFGSWLGLCREDSQFQDIAHFLSVNTAKPFQEGVPDPEEWIGQFTGSNLRWESLGLIFSYGEPCFLDVNKPQSGFGSPSAQKEWEEISRVCLGLCMELSRRFSSANSLLAQLSMRQTIMESMHAGDASYSTWRSGAESAALATFLGMHAESNSPSYEPSLASESRRRLFAQIFIGDVTLFTGRPPRLSHRYAFTPLPLDLTDEDLLKGGEALRAAVESLDENGWNTNGKLYSATLSRARFILALIRDELVEIGIGKARPKVAIALLRDLKDRQLEVVKEFPRSLDYNPADIANLDANVNIIFVRILLQLEQLRNLFLIERLLSKHGDVVEEGDILLISFQLVSLTLLFWTHKDRFAPFRNDFEWLVMAFATPSGGILCMELLNPTFKGSHPKNPSITRSNIIQQLSLLIGFLEWIDPSRPNGNLCVTTSAIMRRVLDHVLNMSNRSMSWPPETLDDMQLDFSFELFDAFDWMRPDVLANQALET
ncbi:n-terminal binuclear zn cluster-containing dna binding domain-containing [Trichoderma arundinaceum]|uniref:N-terminal binuclear zn cluster-containing dna binding domain-containing n=1 Tax=Trichoderma arundinaceum TaxID=490622 RepID=A0A395NDY6_TRIAR|nr:n-terminal binuclear zn cluster-containing dna binding domain-containing [Trichoderma arundinaceum]